MEGVTSQGRLYGKVAIVTGGAHGIGRAYCLGLAKEGAHIVIADLDLSGAEEVARVIEDTGGEALAIKTDVSSEEQALEMAHQTERKFGRIDVLINNAAIFEQVPMSRAGMMDLSVEEWDTLLGVNLKGPWLCARAVFPKMKDQGSGKIINIASGTVFGRNATRPHYVAAKAGIVGLTRNLARELGQYGINVNTLTPGSTLTEDLPPGADVEMRQRAVGFRALKRVQTPQDLVGAAIFLASSDSDFMTGQLLNVDGGAVMY